MDKVLYPRFLIVKDNFYAHPEDVYQSALQSSFYQPEHVTGFRSTTVYDKHGPLCKTGP